MYYLICVLLYQIQKENPKLREVRKLSQVSNSISFLTFVTIATLQKSWNWSTKPIFFFPELLESQWPIHCPWTPNTLVFEEGKCKAKYNRQNQELIWIDDYLIILKPHTTFATCTNDVFYIKGSELGIAVGLFRLFQFGRIPRWPPPLCAMILMPLSRKKGVSQCGFLCCLHDLVKLMHLWQKCQRSCTVFFSSIFGWYMLLIYPLWSWMKVLSSRIFHD